MKQDGKAGQNVLRVRNAYGSLTPHLRQFSLCQESAQRLFLVQRPDRFVQDTEGLIGQEYGSHASLAQHLEHGSHRALVLRQARHLIQKLPDKRRIIQPVLDDGFHDLADGVGITEIHTVLRHDDQDEMIRIGDPLHGLGNARHKEADVIKNQPYLTGLGQPLRHRALPLLVLRVIHETGYDNFASVVVIISEEGIHHLIRVRVFQYGQRRHDAGQAAPARLHPRISQGGETEQIRHSHTHCFSPSSVTVTIVWGASSSAEVFVLWRRTTSTG